MASPAAVSRFHALFRGYFVSLLSWDQLTGFWDTLRARAGAGWYIYAVGEELPVTPRGREEVLHFIQEIDTLLRHDHDEDYCGIVYTDSRDEPSFVKIFDPNHLGVSCGSSKNPPLPGWILSLVPPEELRSERILPERRRRWWHTLWEPAHAG